MNAKQSKRLIFSVFLLAGLLAFATDMVFSFPDERPEHGPLFEHKTMAGITLAGYGLTQQKGNEIVLPKWPLIIAMALLLCHGLLSNAMTTYQRAYQKAYSAKVNGNAPAVISHAERGSSNPWVSLAPNADPIELLGAEAYQAQRQLEPACGTSTLGAKIPP